ncbi:MAG: hypothetical protein ABTQ34_08840 [Bdellovibrionales bacterium]
MIKKSCKAARKFMIAACLCGILSVVPSRAHAVFPVVDGPLGALFLSYYTYLMTVQWPMENSSRAYTNSLIAGSQQGVVEATVRSAQGGVNQQARSVNARAHEEIARKHYYAKGNHLCPLVYQASYVDEAADGKAALVEALNKTIRWIGVGGDNPNADLKLLDTMCKMNLMSVNQAGGLVEKLCKMKISGYEGKAMEANSVVGPIEYTFPSNIKKDKKTGTLLLEDPKEEDMPGLTALFYCVLTHPLTELPAISDRREPTIDDAVQIVRQMRQQVLSNPSGDLCVSALAERMAIPASAPSPELVKVHKAQENFCTQMHHSGCMSDALKAECVKNGMSALSMARHMACKSGNPNCATKGLVARGFGAEDVTKELLKGPDACNAFWDKKKEDQARFISSMSEAIRAFASAPASYSTSRQVR